jgi:nitrite reductase (NO-forming)
MATKQSPLSKHVAILRIIFGLIWGVDAFFKWQPAFATTFLEQFKGAAEGQPSWLQPWFDFWTSIISQNPQGFVLMTAIIETLVAFALIFGVARKFTYIAAAIFSLLIWAIPEGFGGPYDSSSDNVGAGIVYAIVFFSLFGLERLAGRSTWSLDNYIIKRIPWWVIIANPTPAK